MAGDLRKRIEGSRNKVEELVKDIPGYKGYKDKEVRREADKLMRLQVARGFEAQRRRLSRVQVQLTEAGRLGALLGLERALMRLQLLIDRLKTASYGYAGLFDAVKIKEAELDALYDYDAALLEQVGKVETLIDAVAAAKKDEELTQATNALLEGLDEANEAFSKRLDVMLAGPGA